jgi:uncharacterized membrane protein YtjA (UPF0391 family)
MTGIQHQTCQGQRVAENLPGRSGLRAVLTGKRKHYTGAPPGRRRRLGTDIAALLSLSSHSKESVIMLSWALAFFIVAIIAAIFGFTGIAAGAAEIAKILFVVFVVLFLVSLVAGLLRRP